MVTVRDGDQWVELRSVYRLGLQKNWEGCQTPQRGNLYCWYAADGECLRFSFRRLNERGSIRRLEADIPATVSSTKSGPLVGGPLRKQDFVESVRFRGRVMAVGGLVHA